MAKTVWTRKNDLIAFSEGEQARREGLARIARRQYESYNERAAFNDGWDTANRAAAGTGPKGRAFNPLRNAFSD